MTSQGARAALLIAAVLAASACGPGDVPADADQAVRRLDVGLTDFAIATSAGRLASAEVTLRVTNAGATAHDLRIAGDTADVQMAPLRPGEQATVAVDTAGEQTVTLWCTLPGHRQQGMETTLQVTS